MWPCFIAPSDSRKSGAGEVGELEGGVLEIGVWTTRELCSCSYCARVVIPLGHCSPYACTILVLAKGVEMREFAESETAANAMDSR